LVSFNIYDDKFGFELNETIESALDCAKDVHTWLGAKFDMKKTQIGRAVDILGVTYELERLILLIKETRKIELRLEIQEILDCDALEPGRAG
jgi:hypothetical protein